eukprot:6176882-Pleurochrysis_carterae.AAC.1
MLRAYGSECTRGRYISHSPLRRRVEGAHDVEFEVKVDVGAVAQPRDKGILAADAALGATERVLRCAQPVERHLTHCVLLDRSRFIGAQDWIEESVEARRGRDAGGEARGVWERDASFQLLKLLDRIVYVATLEGLCVELELNQLARAVGQVVFVRWVAEATKRHHVVRAAAVEFKQIDRHAYQRIILEPTELLQFAELCCLQSLQSGIGPSCTIFASKGARALIAIARPACCKVQAEAQKLLVILVHEAGEVVEGDLDEAIQWHTWLGAIIDANKPTLARTIKLFALEDHSLDVRPSMLGRFFYYILAHRRLYVRLFYIESNIPIGGFL